jgi:hypothetical protein
VEVFSEISPATLREPEAHIVMVSAVLDRFVPPYVAHDYARVMQGQGQNALSSYSIHTPLKPGGRRLPRIRPLVADQLQQSGSVLSHTGRYSSRECGLMRGSFLGMAALIALAAPAVSVDMSVPIDKG